MSNSYENQADQRMLNELRTGETGSFESLYRLYYPMIVHFVREHRGSDDDAQDVFQEGLLVFVKKIREPGFQLTSKISTFLFAVCRNIWYKKLQGKDSKMMHTPEPGLEKMSQAVPDSELDDPDEKEALLAAISEKMNELEADCRQIILLSFYENLAHSVIAQKMGYAEAFVKVKKFRCLEYLRRKLRELPLFKNQ